MKNNILFLFMLVFLPFSGASQSLSLNMCWEMARTHYPLLKGKRALAEATDLSIQNVKTGWLPQMDLLGQATWQNDVPHVAGMSGFALPEAPKDQYKLWMDVSQTLYDGGRMEARSKLEQAKGEVETQNIEVQLQEVDRRVTELFFTLLMLNEQEAQLQFMQEDLEARIREAEAALTNGVIQASTLKSLKVENLRLMQRLIALQESRKAMLGNLSLYVGHEIVTAGDLIPPDAGLFLNPDPRAEYRFFDLQQEQLDKNALLTQRNRMPAISAFGQAGYGNPTYNMLNDAFGVYYMVGLRLKWSPWDWRQANRANAVLKKQKELIDFQRQTFEVNQKRAVRQIEGEADQYQKIMQKDEEILELQTEITTESRARFKNGTLTSADYLTELNAEARARLDKEINHLRYLQSMALKYLTDGE